MNATHPDIDQPSARAQGTPLPGPWAVRKVWLRYHIGERKLFHVTLMMAVNTAHFTELKDDEYCNWSQWDSIPPNVDGALIRSQPVTNRLPCLVRTASAIRYVPQQYNRYYMEFGKTFEQYLQKFSSQTRSKRKKEVRKFAESCGGAVDLREYRTVEEVREFIRLARELSKKTFQEKLLDAGLPSSEEYKNFLLERAATGHIRAYMLFHKDVPASYLLNEVRDPGIVISLYTGYDPQFRAQGAGSIVYYLAFEKLFAEDGLRMLDFTEGEGTHKQFFATGSKQCADIYYFRPSLRIAALLRLHASMDSASRAAGRLAERLGIKARLKRFLRARA